MDYLKDYFGLGGKVAIITGGNTGIGMVSEINLTQVAT
ncbi:hypothetical protein Ilyop_2163 (plasmid) [Ilyobacter polytropus DSM 2926]|uniref:Uncharacterized protein n=1 Tax=Ilyobacter polytropus (strain ATCC 51220 / DSM 2926 / LMG 16218 / CuHBu1) TaxID=572544 RepID=E3HC83_ILYPC|nr:hypothetical protein Ilyop_2163 [Ilyobacter polytropus DSM 2926]